MKFCDFFIELSLCEQILFAALSLIILLSIICCIVCSIRTKSLSNAFAWASVPAFRASQLYWRLRVIRNGKMCYERFVDEYADVHIKDYDIEKREKQRDHESTLHWNKIFRELVYQRKDLVEKYLLGDKFTRKMYKQLMEELYHATPIIKNNEQSQFVLTKKSAKNNKPKNHKKIEDIKTGITPGNFESRMKEFFKIDRSGFEIGCLRLGLIELTYITPVKELTFTNILHFEGYTEISNQAINDAMCGVDKKHPTGRARTEIDSIKEFFTQKQM